MNEQTLASEIAHKVIQETQFWIALIGFVGVVLGAVITVAGNIIIHRLKEQKQNLLDKSRKELLLKMYKSRDWRKLSTLSRVIGADIDTTKRLLIEIGARGSEKPRDDGEEVWGLISKHPLNEIE